MTPYVPLALAFVGTVALLTGVAAIRRRSADRRLGELVAVDAGRPLTLRSERLRLAGRPDAVRRRPDGAWVPVELKHRPAPVRGPFPSHLVQLGAYCLLIEEATGRPPPFGILRYNDRELVVPWDGGLRARTVSTLAQLRERYDGRADPGPEKCGRCVWAPRCDASQAGRTPRDRAARRAT